MLKRWIKRSLFRPHFMLIIKHLLLDRVQSMGPIQALHQSQWVPPDRTQWSKHACMGLAAICWTQGCHFVNVRFLAAFPHRSVEGACVSSLSNKHLFINASVKRARPTFEHRSNSSWLGQRSRKPCNTQPPKILLGLLPGHVDRIRKFWNRGRQSGKVFALLDISFTLASWYNWSNVWQKELDLCSQAFNAIALRQAGAHAI